jgi:superfamily II DNA or RNA helicase
MRSLQEHVFEPIYFKTRHRIYEEFFRPCLESSIKYDRVTGYFGSSVFVVIKEALKEFISNRGHIRIVCSPVLSDSDLEAIKNGYLEVEKLDYASQIDHISDIMMTSHPNPTLLLSKLITHGYLEIKLAVILNNSFAYGMLHDKTGVFTDIYKNVVTFQGSINETYQGLSANGNSESFEVNTSWNDQREFKRTQMIKQHFNSIWDGSEPGVVTLSIPETSIEKIKSFQTEKSISELIRQITIEKTNPPLHIRVQFPYDELVVGEKIQLEAVTNADLNEYGGLVWESSDLNIIGVNCKGEINAYRNGEAKVSVYLSNSEKVRSSHVFRVVKWGGEPGKDRRKIRDYQYLILENWQKNAYFGIFKMATGSGKTFTTLCAIRHAIYMLEKIPIILVPTRVLFQQWKKEILKTFGSTVQLYEFGSVSRHPIKQMRIATSQTSHKKIILATLSKIAKKDAFSLIDQGEHLMLIIDEVHNSGSPKNSRILSLDMGAAIGLSATPKRYRDAEGTKKIMDTFREIIQPEYPLEDAIKEGALCPYYYHPNIIELERDEAEKYISYSKKIAARYATLKAKLMADHEIFSDSQLKMHFINRSRIIKKARNKIALVLSILEERFQDNQRWIIYCEDIEQLNAINEALNENLRNLFHNNLHTYHSHSDLHQEVLHQFEIHGGVLLSIRCLDEGVDIPSISHAIILASSQNPRQFIQRRGRVLRWFSRKEHATIYDPIVSPNDLEQKEDDFPFLLYELRRSIRFARHAINHDSAMFDIKEIAIKNDIEIESIVEDEGGFEIEPEND